MQEESVMRAGTLNTALTRLIGLAGAAVLIGLGAASAGPPVRGVEAFQPERYAGMWYELARIPNSLQARCIGDVTATYRTLDDGALAVVQRCRESGDRFSVLVGRAMPLPGDASRARMKLSFMPAWLRWLPSAQDDHWVVFVDRDYRYAVVSDPERRTLHLLSRSPEADAETLAPILARLKAQRYPVERLVATPQRQHRPMPALAARPPLIV
jgi:apolipoprotein D and lipocalin family protein